MKLAVIIVNYNTCSEIKSCLAALKKFQTADSEIIVVDNASIDASVEMIKNNYPGVTLIESPDNLGFSKASNLGFQKSSAEFVIFLNPDTELIESSFDKMLAFMEAHPDIGALGPRLIYKNGGFQISTGSFPGIFAEFRMRRTVRKLDDTSFRNQLACEFSSVRNVDWVTGACLMLRSELFSQLNGFDETLFMFFEDVDLCKRIQDTGYRIVYFPETSIIHHCGTSYGKRKFRIEKIYRDSQRHYYRKHNGLCANILLTIYLKFLKHFRRKNSD